MSVLDTLKAAVGFGGSDADPVDEVSALDAEVEHLDRVVLATLTARATEASARIVALQQTRNSLLDAAATAASYDDGQRAEQQLADVDADIRATELESRNVAAMTIRQQARRAQLVEARAAAQHRRDEQALADVARRVQAVGHRCGELADALAAAIRDYVEADNAATQLASKLREPHGRHLADRLQFALSRHLWPALECVGGMGTSVELSVTLARSKNAFAPDGMTFDVVSIRPFTPRAPQTAGGENAAITEHRKDEEQVHA